MNETQLQYFNQVLPHTPSLLHAQLAALPDPTKLTIDTLLRFVLHASCAEEDVDMRASWGIAQKKASEEIAKLAEPVGSNGVGGTKRAREEGDMLENSKRAKIGTDEGKHASRRHVFSCAYHFEPAKDDPPLFTLHALSFTSPIRKKANVTIHAHTLRLTHPTTHVSEHVPIPLDTLKRAFLLPTRGKTKPHWTVVLLPTDVPALGKSGKDKDKDDSTLSIVFGLDAMPAGFSTSDHVQGTLETMHAKGTPTLPALRAFLAHLPIPTLEPSTDVFRSAFSSGSATGGSSGPTEGTAGIEAYRGAKQGTLWFFASGVLWDGRPAEFFAVEDLARTEEGEVRAVRTISATGRTCSAILRRVEPGGEREEQKGGGDEEEEERVVDVDFGMIDGKEQDGIARWAKRCKNLFGRKVAASSPSKLQGGSKPNTNAQPNVAANIPIDDESDEDDSDFVGDDSSDGGSATSDSSSDSSDAASGAEEDVGDDASEDEADVSDAEDEMELDPQHHPLLRPGAMPRMSRAAIEMVADMIVEDAVGGPAARAPRRPPVADSSEDEEDELED
ncbi:uncharacterized protein FIBRA_03031 [Fibroporia radiculosa]|uniref:Histone chaperone RTT106/FACT complex subunit SPT16-like middle domain-containing protein n=1 Tax=Fibroporia radiculosa TaxID=599839 RepID=J4G3V7_9APHY|nr:uncharacterized protein FIBRA_03031 [Fibroporia radiculosa]CCM00983.1 predicted protein [Fibroporia radiculosa]